MNEDFTYIKRCIRQIITQTEPNDAHTVEQALAEWVVKLPEDIRFRAGADLPVSKIVGRAVHEERVAPELRFDGYKGRNGR